MLEDIWQRANLPADDFNALVRLMLSRNQAEASRNPIYILARDKNARLCVTRNR